MTLKEFREYINHKDLDQHENLEMFIQTDCDDPVQKLEFFGTNYVNFYNDPITLEEWEEITQGRSEKECKIKEVFIISS